MPFQQPGHTVPDGGQIQTGHPHGFRIPLRAVLHVHGHIVHQALFPQPDQPIRMIPIGVQLHWKSQVLDAVQQAGQARAQQRLSPGDAHPVQQALPLAEKLQQSFLVHQDRHRSREQLGVVAEGAAEVAPPQKHGTSYLSRPVQQGHFLQALNIHRRPLLCFFIVPFQRSCVKGWPAPNRRPRNKKAPGICRGPKIFTEWSVLRPVHPL